MNKIKYTFILLELLFFSGCASREIALDSKTGFTALIAMDRKLEMEPCGCSMNQVGGLQREWQLAEDIRAEGRTLLYIQGGRTFVPDSYSYSKKHLRHYRTKTQVLMEVFQKLGVSLIAPTEDDLKLGIPFLKKAAEKYGQTLVASNLLDKTSGKPIFNEYAEFSINGAAILVLNALPASSKVLDPVTTINAILKRKLSEKPYFTVVVSSDPIQNPLVNLVVTPTKNDLVSDFYQLTKNTVQASVRGDGKTVARVDVLPVLPVQGLYSGLMSEQMRSNEEGWKKRLESKAGESPEDLKVIERYLAQVKDVPRKPDVGLTHYEYSAVNLSKELERDGSSNPIPVILEKLKDSIYANAVSK